MVQLVQLTNENPMQCTEDNISWVMLFVCMGMVIFFVASYLYSCVFSTLLHFPLSTFLAYMHCIAVFVHVLVLWVFCTCVKDYTCASFYVHMLGNQCVTYYVLPLNYIGMYVWAGPYLSLSNSNKYYGTMTYKSCWSSSQKASSKV